MRIRQAFVGTLVILLLLSMISACGSKPADTSESERNDDPGSVTVSEDESSGGASATESPNAGSDGSATDGTTNSGNAGGKTTTKSKTTAKVDAFGERPTRPTADQPKVIDMKGATLTLGTKWITDWGNVKPGTSADGDKWIAWRKNFEKTYHCKLKNVQMSAYTLFESISTKLMAGDKVADIITMQLFDVEAFRHAGLLQPLQKSESLNLEHKMVVQDMVNNFTFNGNSYLAVYGDFIPEVNGVFVNRDMIKSLKLQDPFALVKQKKWTWAAFDAMCKAAYKDLNGNQKIDVNDRFGAAMGIYCPSGTLRCSGAQIITYKNGSFAYTFNTKKTLNFLTNIKNTFKAGNRIMPSQNYDNRFKKFAKGELLFCEGPCNAAAESKTHPLYSAEFAYGYLPCPVMEEGTACSNSGSTWLGGFAIPKNTDQLTNIGYLLNAYADMSSNMTAETNKGYLRGMGGDQESFDVLMKYCRNFRPEVYCWQNEFKVDIEQKMGQMFSAPDATPASYLEGIDSSMKNAVKDYYSKDPDLMK